MENRISATSFLPTSAVLEMTYACNHKCLFCSCPWEYPQSNYQKGNLLSLQEWKDCIKKLIDMGVCNFSYTGGEPLLNPHIKEIIEYTASLKAKFVTENLEIEEKEPYQYLISNGQLLDYEMLVFLKKYNINLSMSLPGLNSYHQHTQNGNYEKILTLFKQAKELDLNTTVNIAVTRKNLGELYETISNALLAGANTLLLNRFLPGGRGMINVDELFLNKEETRQMLTIAEEVLKKANRFGSVGTELPICLINDMKFENLTVGTKCAAAIGFFVVGPEGMVRACNHSPVQLCHYSEIEKLKNDEYWKTFVFKKYLPENCLHCELNYLCDGGCREAAHIYNNTLKSDDPVFVRCGAILKN
jgi:radical SAM protein with 4Fe4S-binding SPASM domain